MATTLDWQLADAKNRFSEVVDRATSEGPQRISKRGVSVAVVISMKEYQRLTGKRLSFKQFLRQGADFEDLDLTRDRSPERTVDL